MQDDSQSDQRNQNQMSGVDSLAGQPSGLSSGAITDPTSNTDDSSAVSDEQPFQTTGSYDNEDVTQPVEDTPASNDSPGSNVDEEANYTPPSDPVEDTSPSTDSSSDSSPSGNDDLTSIKQQALEQLSPLVHKLNQSPEEKYKTIMMMIQASDNQSLLREAYETAEKITDEKAKAEALLNIVNEINYFTQNSNQ